MTRFYYGKVYYDIVSCRFMRLSILINFRFLFIFFRFFCISLFFHFTTFLHFFQIFFHFFYFFSCLFLSFFIFSSIFSIPFFVSLLRVSYSRYATVLLPYMSIRLSNILLIEEIPNIFFSTKKSVTAVNHT